MGPYGCQTFNGGQNIIKGYFLPRLQLYGAGTDEWLDAGLILKPEFTGRITRGFKEKSQLGTKFTKGCLQLVPCFPNENQMQRRERIPWIKRLMARSAHTSW